jgi:hypothetical protein
MTLPEPAQTKEDLIATTSLHLQESWVAKEVDEQHQRSEVEEAVRGGKGP